MYKTQSLFATHCCAHSSAEDVVVGISGRSPSGMLTYGTHSGNGEAEDVCNTIMMDAKVKAAIVCRSTLRSTRARYEAILLITTRQPFKAVDTRMGSFLGVTSNREVRGQVRSGPTLDGFNVWVKSYFTGKSNRFTLQKTVLKLVQATTKQNRNKQNNQSSSSPRIQIIYSLDSFTAI